MQRLAAGSAGGRWRYDNDGGVCMSQSRRHAATGVDSRREQEDWHKDTNDRENSAYNLSEDGTSRNPSQTQAYSEMVNIKKISLVNSKILQRLPTL
ncbi:hypothetical protein PR202_gb26515 [Eleusine coracana subsp. coracana]|uniref:Uncharacterized protein n=1 Tax=Eleusine coracana subsp. coracana TaxID=191504 RepID=A0AAV5FPE2_ELECO|nr:hypothetical protein PR202_gb26515 [Eleusine coracana subsp. coracana]